MVCTDLQPFTTRSRNMSDFVSYDASTVRFAPLPLMRRNGRTKKVVRYGNQRQRRWCRDDSSYVTLSTVYCERVVYGIKIRKCIARREVKEPEVPSGVFAYFCHC